MVGDISLRRKTLQVEPRVEERLGVPLGAFQSKMSISYLNRHRVSNEICKSEVWI